MAQLLSIPGLYATSPSPAPDPEAELRAVRAQAGLVRTLLADLDELTGPGTERLGEVLSGQAVEELTYLACRMLEAAAAIAPHRMSTLLPRKLQFPAADGSEREPTPPR